MAEAADATAAPAPGRSIRFRLLAIALLPTLVILPLLLGVTVVRWNGKFNDTLISKVNGDLTIAHQYLAHIVQNTGERLQAIGNSAQFQRTVSTDADNALNRLLDCGYADIYLTTDDFRLPALKTYLQLGFLPDMFNEEMPERWKMVCQMLNWQL